MKPGSPASNFVSRVLWSLSAVALGLAVCSAILLVALRLIHLAQPNLLLWPLKSAIPLILIGVAFASMQFALPRTRTQFALGFVVSAAFIGWGFEQFLSNRALISLIDDFVVFLFVLDLSIVIYSHLKPGGGQGNEDLPFDETCACGNGSK
jgi:hypothetical protein